MTTIDDIKNNALYHIGAQPVVDFGVSTEKKAKIVQAFYPVFKKKLLAMHRWTFSRKRATLSGGTPVVDKLYDFEFSLPADFIQMLGVYNNANWLGPINRYEILGDKLYTDKNEVFAYYIFESSEDAYPQHYRELLEVAFAAEICYFLTGDRSLTTLINAKAYGSPAENNQGGLFNVAARIDSRQNPPKVIDDSPILSARQSGLRTRRL